MKKIIRLVAIILTLNLLAVSVSAAGGNVSATLNYPGITVSVNGTNIMLTDVNGKAVDPFVMDETVFLPIRAVAEALGCSVSWDSAANTVVINSGAGAVAGAGSQAGAPKTGTVRATLCYSNAGFVVNSNRITLTAQPFVIDGTTYLPVNAVSEVLGCEVTWDHTENKVAITSAANDVLKAGAGTGEIILPQEYFDIINEDGSITYEDGFNGKVHTFAGAKGEIKDSPMIRVLLLQDTVKAAIVSMEIAQAPDDQVAYTKEIVSEICGVDPANVWVHSTHQFGFMHRPGDAAKAAIYDAAMKNAVTEAARQAVETFQPAVLGVGTGDCHVSANKNITRPDGVEGGPYYGPGSTLETNTTMTILRFDSLSGEPIGFFMSYGVKPSALCTTGKTVGNRELNSEVPGVACKLMEEEFDAPCVFCMPAAGDQYPRETAQYYGFDENGEWKVIDIGFEEGIKIVDRLGAEMGTDAIRIANTITCTETDADVRITATSFSYPNKAGDSETTIPIDAIALGGIVFVGFRQEMDCATEQAIWDASPYDTTLLVSFLNGDGKYMAHKEAYDFNNGIGTWEAARTAFAVGAAEKFVDTASGLLKDLYAGNVSTNNNAGPENGKQNTVSNGTIEFAGLNWYVLDKKDGKTLVMSEKVLEMRAYHETDEPMTWETCDLRAYLNGEFLQNTFTAEEQAKIVETTNRNPSNAKYGISGGNATNDKVFLLSLEEAELYLGGFQELLTARTDANETVWWHLRSPGEAANVAASISANGLIDYHGVADSVIIPIGGVRPVLWLDLG